MRPNTELVAIITDANGVSTTLHANARHPGDRPQNMQHSTQLGSGFFNASFTLARPIYQENNDLHLGDDVRFVGANGEIAFEGYITSLPRSMDTGGHSLTVNIAGWAAALADNPFSMPFVDRDLSHWQGVATNRRVDILGAGYGTITDPSVSPDLTGRATLKTAFGGPWSLPIIAEAWYDAGPGNAIGQLTATWHAGTNVNTADPQAEWWANLCADDRTTSDTSANLRAAGPGTVTVTATSDDRRFACLQFLYAGVAGADGVEYSIDWSGVIVEGAHGITLVNGGVTASEAIRWAVANYAPLLNTAGVQDTTWPIEQLVAEEMTVNDLILRVNSYHNWLFAVWENRTLHYGPYDLSEWDYEIRHDVRGTSIGLQGDEFGELRNRLRVSFTNVATGKQELLSGDDYAQLRDDSLSNPYNEHGRVRYGPTFSIPYPTTVDGALELGRIKLLEDNTPRAPGTFTLTGHVHDRAGVMQPAWVVRAGQRVRLTSTANLSDRPRMIHETSYSHGEPGSVSVSVDGPASLVDALFDRTTTALQAAGLQ